VGAAVTGSPAEPATALRERLAGLADLRGVLQLLEFDQETLMPPAGAAGRAEQLATLSGVVHEAQTDPALLELIEATAAAEPAGADAPLVRIARRDADKARRVPNALVRDIARAGSIGQEAWARAREEDDFAAFLPHLERNLELARSYAACFEVAEPYDALLDDYEPGMLTPEVRTVFAELRDRLPALVAAAAEGARPPLRGPFPVAGQRVAVRRILERVGFDASAWVLADSTHPFCSSPGPGDNRITTRYSEDSLDSVMSALHEFGHGLYEAQVDPALRRSPLGEGVSMAVHESQSRLWEIFVGMSVPFWRGAWPLLTEPLGGALDGLDPESFVAALGAVRPSLIRVEADPVSYPLHILLRFDLELALVAGDLAPADLPAAWREGMRELLGVEVPDDRHGVLQDVHWSFGSFGYFPTYALGTLLAAQLWEAARAGLPDLDAQLEAGDLDPLREWLGERVHRHGRCLDPADLVRQATGGPLEARAYLDFVAAQTA
jgi:carboxypeptidase Taq